MSFEISKGDNLLYLRLNLEFFDGIMKIPKSELTNLVDAIGLFKKESVTVGKICVAFFKESKEYFYIDYDGKVHQSYHIKNLIPIQKAIQTFATDGVKQKEELVEEG